ncbi:MAG: hypothetical protein KatS3mg014_2671 [Actinomycetota bacterium]|nr:MAG: hypothetical protein KatS3mg014_2671 [Actinomycetota bacterium]
MTPARLVAAPLLAYLLVQSVRLPRSASLRRFAAGAAALLLAALLAEARPRFAAVVLAVAVLVLLGLVLAHQLPDPFLLRSTTRRIRRAAASIALLLGAWTGAAFLAARILPAAPADPPGAALPLGAGLLFALAVRRMPVGGENEIAYEEIHRLLVGGGLVFLGLAAFPLFVPPRVLLPAAAAAAAVLWVAAASAGVYFAAVSPAREIRLFLALFLPGIGTGAVALLGGLGPMGEAGTLLGSRILLALASLFILRQYLRWGFVAARTIVVLLVLLSAAALVSFVSFLLAPVALEPLPSELAVPFAAAGALEAAVLLALPAVVVHYERGTMRVTWSLLVLGIYLESVVPVARLLRPVGPPDPASVGTALLSYAVVALALLVAMRYIHLLHRALVRSYGEGKPE